VIVPPPVTRFAPSPTGYLHLGHVVNAIYVWGLARAAGGRVLLRIEDHDRLRCRPAYEAALLEDLDWLGFVPDEGRHPPARQSDRPDSFEQALALLDRRGLVYACECSRQRIGGKPYDGRCRDRGLAREPGRGLRVCLDGEPSGDLLVRDRDGHWTYQFAVTVDDTNQGVTLVVRGQDLEDSTGRQVALARLLGRFTPPAFVHHPLIVDETGRKLSKSARDTGVLELRAGGTSAEEVIGLAAAAVGLIGTPARLPAENVATLFQRPAEAWAKEIESLASRSLASDRLR
jgi:glutamyl-tRNA synthetase/glutamyl-Q tRNA(Asp) synthetase